MYVWATLREGLTALSVADEVFKQGHLLAPGNLFSCLATLKIRFNISRTLNSPVLPALQYVIKMRTCEA